MILQSLSASSPAAPPANFPRISRCKWSIFRYSRDQNSRTGLSTRKYVGFVFSNNRFHRKGNLNVFASSNSENGGGSGTGNPNVDSKVANLTTRGTKSIVIKRFSKELDGNNGDPLTREHLQLGSGGSFARFREDPIVDKLRTQLGVLSSSLSPD